MTALIVVDLQRGIVAHPVIHPVSEIVAGRAPGRTEQGPGSTQTFDEGWTELVPELGQQPGDILVTKRSWGAFATTDLEDQLKARDVTQVVITGVATSVGVEATARQAYEQGFHVTLALDAMTDVRKEAHEHSIGSIFPRLGETGTTQEILSLLKKRSVGA
jgi:nicotinamidase-related amidase